MVIYISKKANIKFNIKVYEADVRRFLLRLIAALAAISVVLGAVCLVLASQLRRVTVEAGELLTAAEIIGRDEATFGEDFDPECIYHAGVYYFTIHSRGEDIKVRLRVRDTKAPEVTVKKVFFAVGGALPEPLDFIETVWEPDGLSGEFLTDMPELKEMGTYPMRVRFFDASGNKTEAFDVEMTQIYDSQPPKISLYGDDIIAYVDEAVEYKNQVTLTDNCVGNITLDADESELDISTEGEYTVYLTATDSVGNTSERLAVTVKVVPRKVSDEALDTLIAEVAEEIISDTMSREEMCRAVYDYVRDTLVYSGVSDKTDDVSEAYHALFVRGDGDCFSYFAAAKAFLEHLGIENISIAREKGYTSDTHYWSLVNIGTDDEPAWYHFDCTELRDDGYNHSGCLLTDKQIDAYCKVRPYFYIYDKSGYPETCSEIITKTPALEEFY